MIYPITCKDFKYLDIILKIKKLIVVNKIFYKTKAANWPKARKYSFVYFSILVAIYMKATFLLLILSSQIPWIIWDESQRNTNLFKIPTWNAEH